jgi:hypothetical protein
MKFIFTLFLFPLLCQAETWKVVWFPDWTIAIRYPLSIIEIASSKITVDHTKKLN